MHQNNTPNNFNHLLMKFAAMPTIGLAVVIFVIHLLGDGSRQDSTFQYLNDLFKAKRAYVNADVWDVFNAAFAKIRNISKDHLNYLSQITVGDKIVYATFPTPERTPEEILNNLQSVWQTMESEGKDPYFQMIFNRMYRAKNGVTYNISTNIHIQFKDEGSVKDFNIFQDFTINDYNTIYEITNWDEYESTDYPRSSMLGKIIMTGEEKSFRQANEDEKLKYDSLFQELIESAALPFLGWKADRK